MTDTAINSHSINSLAINESSYEQVVSSVAVASMVLDAELDELLADIIAPEIVAGIRLGLLADFTLNSSSAGIAGMILGGQAEPTINSSSAGIADIELSAFGDITISGGKDSGGVAAMLLGAQIDPYVWTYLYPDGLAPMGLTGLVDRDYRPPLPTTFHPAFERFEVGDDARLGDVGPDGATLLVREGRQRLEVPEEK